MNTRGKPPAARQVLSLLFCRGGGEVPHLVLARGGGTLSRPCLVGVPMSSPCRGLPLTWPGWVPQPGLDGVQERTWDQWKYYGIEIWDGYGLHPPPPPPVNGQTPVKTLPFPIFRIAGGNYARVSRMYVSEERLCLPYVW